MFDHFAKNTLAPLILRAGLAVIFIYHGLGKVNAEKDWGANWAGDEQPQAVQLAVAWGELIGGIAVALGLLTRLAVLGLAGIMVGAIVTVHGPKGFSLQHGGYEYNFAILVICAALFVTGPGTLSVDRLFFRKRSP